MSIITQRGNLAEIVAGRLAERIDSGIYSAGERVPTSLQLCQEFGVSRTVIREAITSLKVTGRVITRQGDGVYVTERDASALNFEIARVEDIRSAMQILELRLGVEMQSVALAAARRTPEALADIARAFDQLATLGIDDPEREAQADVDFHMAIARATCNPHFSRLLEAVMGDISSDLLLKRRLTTGKTKAALMKKIHREHASILAAITERDPQAARKALVAHLEGSLNRYRLLLTEPKAGATET